MRYDFVGRLPNGATPMPKALAAGMRKAAERNQIEDMARIAERPMQFGKGAGIAKAAVDAFEKAVGMSLSPLWKGAEVTGGNPAYSSELIPRRQFEEPKASDVEFLWNCPTISPDLRAAITEGCKRLLNYSDDPEIRSAYFWGGSSLTPLREAISDLEDQIGSKISVIYRLIGVTPETAPGHAEGDATDQDSTPRRTRSRLDPLSIPADPRGLGIDYDPTKPTKAARTFGGLGSMIEKARIDMDRVAAEAFERGRQSVLAQSRPVAHRIGYPR
jgi:hypothetical protein